MSGCPFCNPDTDRVIYESELVIGLWDGFPVSPGHALLVTKRHIGSWFEADADEVTALLDGIQQLRFLIEQQHQPDGYNIGVNSGTAAGQTVPHLHLHVIPRYDGDVENPRGGVRWVVPDKAAYWSDED